MQKLSDEQAALQREQAEYSYKGYALWHEEDRDDDCIKIWHHILTPGNHLSYVNWTPYQMMTQEDLQVWVDLGCPGRVETSWGSFNLDHDYLMKMKASAK